MLLADEIFMPKDDCGTDDFDRELEEFKRFVFNCWAHFYRLLVIWIIIIFLQLILNLLINYCGTYCHCCCVARFCLESQPGEKREKIQVNVNLKDIFSSKKKGGVAY